MVDKTGSKDVQGSLDGRCPKAGTQEWLDATYPKVGTQGWSDDSLLKCCVINKTTKKSYKPNCIQKRKKFLKFHYTIFFKQM